MALTSAAAVVAIASAGMLIALSLRRAAIATAALAWRSAPPATGRLPRMLVVCAFRDAGDAVPAFAAALAAQRYPRELLAVRLVDDGSSDATPRHLRAAAEQLPNCRVTTLDRAGGSGKGFAIKQALPPRTQADAEVLVVLDADHRLAPDALHRLAGCYADPAVAAVAFRHAATNAGASAVARYCALEGLVTETVQSGGQAALGLVPKLAGAWSVRACHWELYDPRPGEIADDFRLTAILAAAGARVVYAGDVRSTHLVPETLAGYLRQHLRWAHGINSGALWNCAAVLRSPRAPLRVRLDTALTMLGYGDRLLWLVCIAALAGWSVPAMVSAGVAVAAAGGVVVYSIAVGLWLERRTLADLPRALLTLTLFPIDILVAMAGTMSALFGYRVRWETREEGLGRR